MGVTRSLLIFANLAFSEYAVSKCNDPCHEYALSWRTTVSAVVLGKCPLSTGSRRGSTILFANGVVSVGTHRWNMFSLGSCKRRRLRALGCSALHRQIDHATLSGWDDWGRDDVDIRERFGQSGWRRCNKRGRENWQGHLRVGQSIGIAWTTSHIAKIECVRHKRFVTLIEVTRSEHTKLINAEVHEPRVHH